MYNLWAIQQSKHRIAIAKRIPVPVNRAKIKDPQEIADIIPSDQLDFHVWSSPKNIPAFDYDYWTSKDYDGYRERGMTVHLDEHIDNNDDMLVAWTHMARASILIMSQSSFSMVPAYMNTNCVIFPSNIDAPLENWVNGRDESRASS